VCKNSFFGAAKPRATDGLFCGWMIMARAELFELAKVKVLLYFWNALLMGSGQRGETNSIL